MSNVKAPAAYPACSDNMTAEQASSFLPPEKNENGVRSSSTKQPLVAPKAQNTDTIDKGYHARLLPLGGTRQLLAPGRTNQPGAAFADLAKPAKLGTGVRSLGGMRLSNFGVH